FRHPFHFQFDRSCESSTRADAHVLFAIRRKSWQVDLQRVRSGSQVRKPESPRFIRDESPRPANQRLGRDTNLTTRNRRSLFIPDRSDEVSGQALGGSEVRQQQAEEPENWYQPLLYG